jgi:hypothetical protein
MHAFPSPRILSSSIRAGVTLLVVDEAFFQTAAFCFGKGSIIQNRLNPKHVTSIFSSRSLKGRELYILDELNLGGQRKSYGDI